MVPQDRASPFTTLRADAPAFFYSLSGLSRLFKTSTLDICKLPQPLKMATKHQAPPRVYLGECSGGGQFYLETWGITYFLIANPELSTSPKHATPSCIFQSASALSTTACLSARSGIKTPLTKRCQSACPNFGEDGSRV